MLVDHGDHGDHGQRDHHDLHAHGQALDHQSAHNRQIGLEQPQLPATYPQGMAAQTQPAQQGRKAHGIGNQRGHCRALDAHARHGAPAKDQQRVERHVQRHDDEQKPERRSGVSRAAQGRRHKAEHEQQRNGQKDDFEISLGQWQRCIRCAHPLHEMARKWPAQQGNQQ